MESQRSILVIGLLLVSFLLWQQWQVDHAPAPVQAVEQHFDDTPQASDADVPASGSDVLQAKPQATSQYKTISVKTDTLDVVIDTTGGDIISANLVKFPVSQKGQESYSLLRSTGHLYIAQSGLIGANGPDANSTGRPAYSVPQNSYTMTSGELDVPMTYTSEEGLQVTKTFIFTPGEHQVKVQYTLTNTSQGNKSVKQYGQLKQSTAKDDSGNMFMPTYRGAAFSTADTRYEKYSFDKIADNNLNEVTVGGWVGMLEHYFVSAWVPPQDQTNKLESRENSRGDAIIRFIGEDVTIAPGETKTIESTLYMGPKDQDKLAAIARGLDLTVDYGILWWISKPLFALLQLIHSLVGNWGLAIILITLVVKGAMYPLTKAQYVSMAKMRGLAPKMNAIKERFGDDRQKMSQAMMELYKKEKVNPMGGCFPLLLQMPIFLALYWVFLESVELRHADFFLWITDLSVKDPYFVLPVLTGATMFLLQKLQPTTVQDPMQQKIMQFMPVFMSIFFLWFPAGLVLYWFISNVITLIQAKIIYRAMDKQGLKRS